jgi:hypothetical protein
MPAPRSTFRRWLARLIVFSVATVLALLAAEVATRIVWRKEAILFPRYHTDATYGSYKIRRLRPNTTFYHTSADGRWAFTTNSLGYRDTREWKDERSPGVGRILVLGDSHTQGFECRQDHTYAAILEKRLRAMGQSTEVFNCGVSGFGTAEQLVFLEQEGLKYQPDAVVVGWFANDLNDNVNSGLFTVRDGALVEAKHEHLPGIRILNALNDWAIMRRLSEDSYFYSLLFNRIWEWRRSINWQRSNQAAPIEFAGAAPAPNDAALLDYQNELAGLLLARMQTTCAKAGIRLVVVDIPSWKAIDDFESSIPAPVLQTAQAHQVHVLTSDTVLSRYRHVAELFVAHGQHHISELTHLEIGMKVAEELTAKSVEAR